MDNTEKSKGITRRESLKLGTAFIGSVALKTRVVKVFASFEMISTPEKTTYSWGGRSILNQPPEWINDALIVSNPAAFVGGNQAGFYTAAENGIKPWGQSLIRWLTSRGVRGNGAVLVRQEGESGGAGLTAAIDPYADYVFEARVHIPAGKFFGSKQYEGMQVFATVLDSNNKILAESIVPDALGDWSTVQVKFSSETLREVRCIVQVKAPAQIPCVYFAEGFRLIRKDYEWWNPQNLFNGSRTTSKLADERDLLINTLDPDAVAGHNGVYLNWDGFFSQKGIIVGGGHWEQEYNHIAIDDPMLKSFWNDGLVRKLDGTEVLTSKLWPGYHMCHNAPAYHNYYKQRFVRIAPEVQLLTQDNISSSSFLSWNGGCFCNSCREKFIKWLFNCWSKEQLNAAGIHNADSFDIVKYANDRKIDAAIKNGIALKDPILKAYIQFSYDSQLSCWHDSVNEAKQIANHPIGVLGNQYGVNGERPYSVALSRISDIICTENHVGGDKLGPLERAKSVLSMKNGQAAGEYKRPVWLYLASLFHSPVAAKSRLRMINAQCWADGGIPMPWATASGASGWFYDIEAHMCRFVQNNRFLYSHCERYANVGLVYSLPTHAWRSFPAFGLSSEKYYTWFATFAQLLEEIHIPYEVNCWSHPLMGDDKISLERLSRYKVLILPGVDCLTDGQHKALNAFQSKGGRIINLMCPAFYNEDVEPRPDNFRLVENNKWLIEIRPELMDNYEHFSKKLKPFLSKSLEDHIILMTDAPKGVWSNLWLDETRDILSLHLVNGNINETEDKFISARNSRWKIRLPEAIDVTNALIISPHIKEGTQQIPVTVVNGWAEIVVPDIESYTIVAFYSGDALIKSADMANEHRVMMKRDVTDWHNHKRIS